MEKNAEKNVEKNVEKNEQDPQLAKLLFLLFVYVADADDALTAREVERLNQLIDQPDWCSLPTVQSALQRLKQDYAQFWRDYQKKTLVRSSATLSEALTLVLQDIRNQDTPALCTALLSYVSAFSSSHASLLSWLGIAAQVRAKVQARDEVEMLLAKFSHPENSEYRDHSAGNGIASSTSATPEQPRPAPTISTLGQLWPAAALEYQSEQVWQRGRIRLQCVAVIPETHDVKTFAFVAVPGKLYAYKPGQFLTLELPLEGKTVRRSYTISSSPSRPHLLHITVKRVTNGRVSNWLHDNMQPGFEFYASGPHGHFSCFDAPNDKLLLIAAGSGITPVMSMLRWLADTQSHADIVLLNNVRTPFDVVFEQELRYLGTRLGQRLRQALVPARVDAGQSWQGPVGRFNIDLIKMVAPDFLQREVFVCGPAGYMETVRQTLAQHGHPVPHFHQESFGGPPVAASTASAATEATETTETTEAGISKPGAATLASTPAQVSLPAPVTNALTAPAQAGAQAATPMPAAPMPAVPTTAVPSTASSTNAGNIELVFAKSGKTVQCSGDDFLLDVAEANGIALESSCRSGNCGTCKVKKLEGKVDMDEQQALSAADLEDNYILCCVGRASSTKLVLDA